MKWLIVDNISRLADNNCGDDDGGDDDEADNKNDNSYTKLHQTNAVLYHNSYLVRFIYMEYHVLSDDVECGVDDGESGDIMTMLVMLMIVMVTVLIV